MWNRWCSKSLVSEPANRKRILQAALANSTPSLIGYTDPKFFHYHLSSYDSHKQAIHEYIVRQCHKMCHDVLPIALLESAEISKAPEQITRCHLELHCCNQHLEVVAMNGLQIHIATLFTMP